MSKRLGHSKFDLTVDTYGHLIGKAGRQVAQAAADLVPVPSRLETTKSEVPMARRHDPYQKSR